MWNNYRYIVVLVGCLVMLGGCVTTGSSCDDVREVRLLRTPTEHLVNNGIKNYEDRNYAAAISILQSLVDNKEATKSEKLVAYKYLAFSHCLYTKDEKRQCREAFKKAIELDSGFKLLPAEAGHPVWGPQFSQVKNTKPK